jgi:hypothetical protein
LAVFGLDMMLRSYAVFQSSQCRAEELRKGRKGSAKSTYYAIIVH